MDQSSALPCAGRRGLPLAIAAQAMLLLAPGLLAIAPPAQGMMLLVPIAPANAAAVEDAALGAGATLAGFGPIPGSRFVSGDRARLLPAALRHGMILVTGNPRICGLPQSES
ncbi:hypothetical protein [Sphingomonas sp. KR3-1]|uniref:hypothetical protein n=1 Tax=Sphingomonas sp. KR3-1 TaxID=3156611 RepID=UPI0032B5D74B